MGCLPPKIKSGRLLCAATPDYKRFLAGLDDSKKSDIL
jgi:hypothetical protein